jgi:hypothetical protein
LLIGTIPVAPANYRYPGDPVGSAHPANGRNRRILPVPKGSVATEQVGELALKGLTQPVVAYNVPLVGGQAAFRVIEGGVPSA